MDLDVAMRSAACPYTVHFYGGSIQRGKMHILLAENTNKEIFVLTNKSKRIRGPNK